MSSKEGQAACHLARLPELCLELLFPARCPFCDAVLGFSGACADCAETLRAATRTPGTPVPAQGHETRSIDLVYAPYFYESTVQKAILRMKFYGRPDLARPLAGRMAEALRAAGMSAPPLGAAETSPHTAALPLGAAETSAHTAAPSLRAVEPSSHTAAPPLCAGMIVPVPSGRDELHRRGYDVPLNLARLLGKELHLPVVRALYKTRETTPQATLSGEERRRNLHGVFAVRDGVPVAGRHILLVDDVYTTGTTLDKCAGALKAAGAVSCTGICIAAVR